MITGVKKTSCSGFAKLKSNSFVPVLVSMMMLPIQIAVS